MIQSASLVNVSVIQIHRKAHAAIEISADEGIAEITVLVAGQKTLL